MRERVLMLLTVAWDEIFPTILYSLNYNLSVKIEKKQLKTNLRVKIHLMTNTTKNVMLFLVRVVLY